MWLAWEGSNAQRSMPSHGSALVAFTRCFAGAFLEHLQQNSEVDHFDLMLLRWFKEGQVSSFARCYRQRFHPALWNHILGHEWCTATTADV